MDFLEKKLTLDTSGEEVPIACGRILLTCLRTLFSFASVCEGGFICGAVASMEMEPVPSFPPDFGNEYGMSDPLG